MVYDHHRRLAIAEDGLYGENGERHRGWRLRAYVMHLDRIPGKNGEWKNGSRRLQRGKHPHEKHSINPSPDMQNVRWKLTPILEDRILGGNYFQQSQVFRECVLKAGDNVPYDLTFVIPGIPSCFHSYTYVCRFTRAPFLRTWSGNSPKVQHMNRQAKHVSGYRGLFNCHRIGTLAHTMTWWTWKHQWVKETGGQRLLEDYMNGQINRNKLSGSEERDGGSYT